MGSNLKVPSFEGATPPEMATLRQFLQDLVKLIDGGLAVKGNLSARFHEVTFRGAGVETPVDHGLGRVPDGWIVVGQTGTWVSVFESQRERSADRIYLISDAANAKVKLMFL